MNRVMFGSWDLVRKNGSVNKIRIHTKDFDKNKDLIVQSITTGVEKVFVLDENLTRNTAYENEGWDGEEQHFFFRAKNQRETDIIVELWFTPYD